MELQIAGKGLELTQEEVNFKKKQWQEKFEFEY